MGAGEQRKSQDQRQPPASLHDSTLHYNIKIQILILGKDRHAVSDARIAPQALIILRPAGSHKPGTRKAEKAGGRAGSASVKGLYFAFFLEYMDKRFSVVIMPT
jgi:hypothetical protein